MGPAAFGGGLLTACVKAQVFLLDPEARDEMARPLAAELQDVPAWHWQPPAVVDDKSAVLSDGDKRLTVVRINNDGKKRP